MRKLESVISREELYKFYIESFNGYYDKELLDKTFNDNLQSAIDSYDEDDNELRIDFYVIAKLKHLMVLEIIKRVKDEGDINSEIYLVEKYRYVHNMYVRKNHKEAKDILYEKAVENAIETYNGKTSFSSYIYKEICEEYSKKETNGIKKVLSDK